MSADINVQLGSKQWELVKCHTCQSTLPTDTVKAYVSSDMFERYFGILPFFEAFALSLGEEKLMTLSQLPRLHSVTPHAPSAQLLLV